jgi:hypothetical protein
MWSRYRKWKHLITPVAMAICLGLMRGEPDESPRWIIGMSLAATMAAFYIGEELVWMKVGKGRPCRQCGQMIPVKTFRLVGRCPHCGKEFG